MQVILSENESGRKVTFQLVETLAERLKHVRKVRGGITQQQMADALDVERGAVGNWERGGSVSLENLSKLSDVYDVPLDWLQKNKGEPPVDNSELNDPSSPIIHKMVPNAVPGPPVALSGVLIPVMGQGAAGPDGSFEFNGEPISYIPAPPRLTHVRGAYAVYVRGDSMEPRYFSGEVVYVDPHKQPERGRFVVAQIAGDEGAAPDAYVKQFLSQDARNLRLMQYNPRKELTFPVKRVVAVHRIVMGGEE